MATIPLETLAPTVDENGISVPTYADILATLQDQYRSIFGSDVYLEPDSQDGQWIAIIAAAVNDINAECVAVYQQFSPATAKGVGLSSVVKINGLSRQIATNSTVDVVIVGVAGTTITNGIVGDALNQRWALPASFDIPPAGDITVTATAVDVGDVEAGPHAITRILTPTRGWQTVDNTLSATPGAPVETDAALRIRQAKSTALPSLTPLKGLVGAVSTLFGVTQVQPYENDTNIVDGNGIPGHTIALVVEGGDAQQIAQQIANKKTLGTGTFGSTTEIVTDPFGIDHLIKFSRPTQVSIQVQISLTALTGFTTAIKNSIQQAVVDYINALPIGADVILTRLYLPVNLYGVIDSATYEATAIQLGSNGGGLAPADVVIPFSGVATCILADVTFVVT